MFNRQDRKINLAIVLVFVIAFTTVLAGNLTANANPAPVQQPQHVVTYYMTKSLSEMYK